MVRLTRIAAGASSRVFVALVISSIPGTFAGRSLSAQDVAVGTELQVNTSTIGNQHAAAVGTHDDGSFLVVWDDRGQDAVMGQRFDANGDVLGSEFLVSSGARGGGVSQGPPGILTNTDGSFVVVVQKFGIASDGSGYGIFGQRFDSSGSPVGSEFPVNTYTPGNQWLPAVAPLAGGDFVVVWEDSGQDGDGTGIRGRRFDATGDPLSPELQINTYTTREQSLPSVAADGSGNFVVVWQSYTQDGDRGGVFGQRFDSSAAPLGAEFQVNVYTTAGQLAPSVAADAEGNFMVVWNSLGDGSVTGITGRRYDHEGIGIGSEFQVNTYTTLGQSLADVAADPDGNFVVVWQSQQDGSQEGIFAQRYDLDGKIGAELMVNTYTEGLQRVPAVALDPQGDFVVAWQSFAQDGNAWGVFAQRFETDHVGDRVWIDTDFDGLQDPGEPGLAGVVVHLFDDFSTLVRTTATDLLGDYRFNGFSPGEHYVQFELPAQYSFTERDASLDDTIDSDADPFTGQTDSFPVAAGESRLDWDAGLAQGVGDLVWHDADADGVQESGEPGFAGVTVRLLDSGGAMLETTTTDAGGHYGFTGLGAGSYRIEVLVPPLWSLSDPDQGADDELDSDVDPTSGQSAPFTYVPGAVDRSRDIGLNGSLFRDGFESGDTSAWSSTSS